MLGDSIKNRLYGTASLNTSSTNNELRDQNTIVHMELYNTHRFNKLQVWYGGGINAGLYYVGPNDDSSYTYFQYFDERRGSKLYSGFTAQAGLTYTLQINRKTEWRIIGLQATFQREYGDYLRFRKLIQEDQIWVNGLAVSPWLLTVSFSSELCWKTEHGSLFYMNQVNLLTGKDYKYNKTHNPLNPNARVGGRYYYYTNTFGYKAKNTTYFLEGYIGKRLIGLQLGLDIPLLTY